MEKIIIGLTGPFGSGCSYVAKEILEQNGYEYISLSEILKNNLKNKNLERSALQDEGNALREKNGAGWLATQAIEKIQKTKKKKYVIDSIRNTHEVEAFKKKFPSFYLFAVFANKDVRWERVKSKYKNNLSLFEDDDKRDKDEKSETGQQITLCYQMADIIILNEKPIYTKGCDNFKFLQLVVKKYLDLIEGKENFVPTEMETLMTMAYANSMRSLCTQRKVGALIIDDYGNVFSSGFNEVPVSQRPCIYKYGKCYRKVRREEINEELKKVLDDQQLVKIVSKTVKTKMLDYCRALHAEENAIVNMARLSVSTDFGKATLYTTTYPCNLCANKIAQVGIKKIVYYEPYPQQEAKETLSNHNVQEIPFEGVTYNSYFKFMEVLR